MPDSLKIEIKDIPDVGEILDRQRQPMLDAGVRALTNAIVRNFRRRNSQGNAKGFPRSNFWQDAAESVTSAVEGDAMSATISKQGVRLRWKGGEVRPPSPWTRPWPMSGRVSTSATPPAATTTRAQRRSSGRRTPATASSRTMTRAKSSGCLSRRPPTGQTRP